MTPVQPIQEVPVQTIVPEINTPERLEEAREFRRDLRARDLVVEMADALETLVQYAGLPFPKYMRVDYDAIAALITQARSLP